MYMNYRCHFGTSCGMSSAHQRAYEQGRNPANAQCVKEAEKRYNQVKRQIRRSSEHIEMLEKIVEQKKREKTQENSMKENLEDSHKRLTKMTALVALLREVIINLSQDMSTDSPQSTHTKKLRCITCVRPNLGDVYYAFKSLGLVVCEKCKNENESEGLCETEFVRLFPS